MHCPGCGTDNIPGVDACEHCGFDLAGLDLPEAGSGFRGHLLSDRIGDLEITPAVLASPDASVAEVIRLMREARQGCALIVDKGELIGLFNERHVLTRVLRPGLDTGTAISLVMSRDPLRLSPEDPPAFAVHCMVARGFRHLPVTAGGEILGFISVRNILNYIHRDVLATG